MIDLLIMSLGDWLETLNTIQMVAAYVFSGCLVIFGLTFVWDWLSRRD